MSAEREAGPEEDATNSASSFSAQQAQRLTAAHEISCTVGTVYSVSEDGQLREIDSSGAVANVGAVASGVTSFNGLGIDGAGQAVYAYERTNNVRTATMYVYDVATGTWTNTHDTYDTRQTGTGAQLIAGAVNLSDGKYLFGGYETTQSDRRYTQVFKIWQYDPDASSKFSYKGYVTTYSGRTQPETANGDMAFDTAGNLFIVRGTGSTTTVFSVTASNLSAASGGAIPSSGSNSFTTTSNVNGAAFDSAGTGFLGAANTVQGFDMPSWSNNRTITSGLSKSSDLASCSSPVTITVEKVVNGRVSTGDQFTLALADGSTQLGTATTQGTSTGVQAERVGPQPTMRGKTLTFSETAAEGANLADYATSYQCTVDGEPMSPAVEGVGPVGSVTVPDVGDAVLCQFTNAPLVAHVNVTKTVLDSDGAQSEPGAGWTVGVSSTAVSGSVTQQPAGEQQTDAQGKAAWEVDFATAEARADIAVHELQQPGFQFSSGQCVVTGANGEVGDPIRISGESGTTVRGVKPGETVDCAFTNQEKPSTLTLTKVVDNRFGGTAAAGDFALTAAPEGGAQTVFESGETREIESGDYTLAEAQLPGYTQQSLVCVDEDHSEIAVTEAQISVPEHAQISCTFTNTDRPGSVSWTKTDADHTKLSGSEWKLVGPDGAVLSEISDEACAASATPPADAPYCVSTAPGIFAVHQLSWGEYELVETRAPAGYRLDATPHTFTVGPETAFELDLGAITNTQLDGPELPLTGGQSAALYSVLGGGTLVAALAFATILRRRQARRHA